MKNEKRIKKYLKNSCTYLLTCEDMGRGKNIPVLHHGNKKDSTCTKVIYADIAINTDGTVVKYDLDSIANGKIKIFFGGEDKIVAHIGDGTRISMGFEGEKVKFSAFIVTEVVVACTIYYDSEHMFDPYIYFVQGEDRITNIENYYMRIMELGFCEGTPSEGEIKSAIAKQVEEVVKYGEETEKMDNSKWD